MTGPPERVAAVFDCHVHSQYSPDGKGTIHELAAQARRRGIQGWVATDHNTDRMWKDIRDAAFDDLLVVPGIEVSTADGHCLAIGVRGLVRRDRSLADTLDEIRAQGGVGVPSHPYRWTHGVGAKVLARTPRLVALEVYNASDGDGGANPRAAHYAEWHNLGGTGGSDCHRIVELGNAYTMFPEFPHSVDEFVSQIERGRTWGAGTATPWRYYVLQKALTLKLWAKRGFRSV